ncbi:MAG: class I SAM-dependent methyltransferase [Dehalococcoidia bacterium]|nr:class I SAM-dependent methyltransferase [Dehalococcoidia bacterium]
MAATSPRVVVTAAPGFEGIATLSARSLRLEVAAHGVKGIALHLDERGWSLRESSDGGTTTVRADFLEGRMAARIRDAHRGEARLATALGLKKLPTTPLVLDATAGLGRDSVLAAALGCEVIACERSPIVALLLRDALVRADGGGLRDLAGRIEVRDADAREVLAALEESPDVVLVDPMFPERPGAAKPQKEMQLLQRLLGPDTPEDTAALLDAALQHATRRVVVKRPPHAPPVGDRKPSFTVEGKAVRYDVYVTGGMG